MPELQEYVTVQTHDAQLGRIEALMEANLAHQELIASELRSEIREIKGEIKCLFQLFHFPGPVIKRECLQ